MRADPTNAAALLDEAAGHAMAGRLDAARAAYERAQRADPGDFRPPMSLATIALQRGRPDLALPALRRAAALKPDLFDAHHNLGAVAQGQGLWDEAAGAYARALGLRPGAAPTRQAYAAVLALLGRLGEAEAQHRRLASEPATRLWALTRLALLRPGAITEAELADMSAAAADPATDLETRTGLSFAIGEALEQRGRDAAAFEAFAGGNRLKRAQLAARPPTDPVRVLAAHSRVARRVRETFDAGRLGARARGGLATRAPIFVIGFPRSGSTLIEQILGAHPEVQPMGETAELPRLLERGALEEGGAERTRTIARAYLEAIRRRGWSGRGRFVDKTLENFLHVGAIAAMFPNAVILEAVRDPMDVGLSCWRQLFATGSETLYDLAEIGAELRIYGDVMDHWRAALPCRVVQVGHEALVADPPAQIRWLVGEAAGLVWDEACLRFHEARAPVRTASAAQVREPIFRTSLGRWRRYEAQLAPLCAALAGGGSAA